MRRMVLVISLWGLLRHSQKSAGCCWWPEHYVSWTSRQKEAFDSDLVDCCSPSFGGSSTLSGRRGWRIKTGDRV